MRLSYRGVQYDHESIPVDLVDRGISGQYRGQSFAFTYPRHIPVPQATVRLQYRGLAYQSTATGGVAPVGAAHPELAPGEQAVAVPLSLKSRVRQVQASEITKVHLESIRQRLQHRIDVAKANGDATLLNELEKEMHLLA